MLAEQKTIFYRLSDYAVLRKVELEDFQGVRYIDLASDEIGEHYYILRLILKYWEGEEHPELCLEGVIEDDAEGILRMALASMSVEGDIDLRALIKEFKNDVDDKCRNRFRGRRNNVS